MLMSPSAFCLQAVVSVRGFQNKSCPTLPKPYAIHPKPETASYVKSDFFLLLSEAEGPQSAECDGAQFQNDANVITIENDHGCNLAVVCTVLKFRALGFMAHRYECLGLS